MKLVILGLLLFIISLLCYAYGYCIRCSYSNSNHHSNHHHHHNDHIINNKNEYISNNESKSSHFDDNDFILE